MNLRRVLSLAGGVLVLGCGGAWAQAPNDAPPLEPPLNGAPREANPAPADPPTASLPLAKPPLVNPPLDDPATLTREVPPASPRDVPGRVSQAPPPPLAERPKGNPPSPDARWVDGYWDYDASRRQYAWVAGAWRVPPPGKVWVNGSWQRDDRGWYRVPGSWVDHQPAEATDWRQAGPPADRPQEAIGAAPRPGAFYIPGTYIPDGDRVVWRSGFWTASQPGWEWIPARWVRLSDGWDFREGHWIREGAGPGLPFAGRRGPSATSGDRYVVSRPAGEAAPRPGPDDPVDAAPIPDQDVRRATTDPVGPASTPAAGERSPEAQPDPDEAAGVPEQPARPVAPPATVPAPVVIRPGLPIPYWDGQRLVVPPTRFSAGVVVNTPGAPGNPVPYPGVGVLPPRGPMPGPRGGLLGGRVRGLLDRVLP